jgi:hypothetical protein
MRLRFGDFVLDAGTRQLRRGAEERHIGPKAFELRAGRLGGAAQHPPDWGTPAPFDFTSEQRQKILELAQDLPRLWHAETTRQSQRKEVLRLLIEDVTVTNVDVPWSIAVGIHWKTGTLSHHQAQRPLPHPQTTAPAVITRIQALYQTNTDAQTAERLNAEGHRSGYGKPFTAERVAHIRTRRGWKKYITGLKGQGPFVH